MEGGGDGGVDLVWDAEGGVVGEVGGVLGGEGCEFCLDLDFSWVFGGVFFFSKKKI